ncbi:MAG: HAMP domain-containing histidine kinase [Lysobacter sp.]|jgi:signal transduction histidine kinase|nr:HAMP domain-containing histidine kinase [Lysobacter sp.]
MLHEFLETHRDELIARCRAKVAGRNIPGVFERELSFGISIFLDQVIDTLRAEGRDEADTSRKLSGPAGGVPAPSEIAETASRHGRELQQHGFTSQEVVHDYGDLCQAITDLAFERSAPIEVDGFRTLNRCLDNAIATAVSEFGYLRDQVHADEQNITLNQRLGSFAHELRNSLSTATLALEVIKRGNVGVSGSTGAVLDRSLVQMRMLIDRSLAEAQIAAGLTVDPSVFSLADFITETRLSASLEAEVKGRVLIVATVDPKLAISGDRNLLSAALGNLLQNAFKFSHANGEVTLSAFAAAGRILIEVEDSCGGLADGDADAMFKPFVQTATDRTGAGLGLSIARASIEAHGGSLRVRNIAGSGCVFTIELPRHLDTESEASMAKKEEKIGDGGS